MEEREEKQLLKWSHNQLSKPFNLKNALLALSIVTENKKSSEIVNELQRYHTDMGNSDNIEEKDLKKLINKIIEKIKKCKVTTMLIERNITNLTCVTTKLDVIRDLKKLLTHYAYKEKLTVKDISK